MKKIAAILLIFFGLALGANAALATIATDAATAAATAAAVSKNASYSGTLMSNVNDKCINKGDCSLCDLIQVGVNLSDMIVAFSGAIAILMFIFGGIVMITAYGSDRITMGKNTIVATIVGILIIFTAWTVVNTLIMAFYGPTSGTFTTALSSMTGGSATAGNNFSYKCTAGTAAAPATPAKK